MDDTKTVVWAPMNEDFCAKSTRHTICEPPPIINVKYSHYAAYPPSEIAAATLNYEKQIHELLQFCADNKTLPKMAFMENNNSKIAIQNNSGEFPENLWFIGDLHGDLLALLAAMEYIDNYPSKTPPVIIFLGDAYDRFEYGYEVLLTIFNLMINRPGKILYLVGNHDIELYYKRRFNVFYPGVMPADFCEWLNIEIQKRNELSIFGQNLIDLFKRMPHALFLSDGTFAAHGGVPHVDIQRTMHGVADLNTIAARLDFVWGRFDPRRPRVAPNRNHKDLGLGYQDFDDFCNTASEILDMPVRRMVHAHEHPIEQWMYYPRYRNNPILTINSHRMITASGPLTNLAIARGRFNDLPEIHILDLTIPAITI